MLKTENGKKITNSAALKIIELRCKKAEQGGGIFEAVYSVRGADLPRPIQLRQRASDGKQFLWEQSLLMGVKTPKAADPWV